MWEPHMDNSWKCHIRSVKETSPLFVDFTLIAEHGVSQITQPISEQCSKLGQCFFYIPPENPGELLVFLTFLGGIIREQCPKMS